MNSKYVWHDRKHILGFLPWSFTKYKLTKDRLLVETGFFNSKYEETYLYRLFDVKLNRSFWEKICGTGTITLYGSDISSPTIQLVSVKSPLDVKEMLSQMILQQRREHRVLETSGSYIDLEDRDGDGFPDFLDR